MHPIDIHPDSPARHWDILLIGRSLGERQDNGFIRHGPADRPNEELRAEARAKSPFSNRGAGEARARGLPVVESHPFETLIQRIMEAVSRGPSIQICEKGDHSDW
ncbi:MAG: hypothetical protein R3A46_03985 [Thermomicrobiales bacterium]